MLNPLLYNRNIINKQKNHTHNKLLAFKGDLENLEPKDIWNNFEEISKIYRESGHCEDISNFLEKKLNQSGFETYKETNGIGKNNIYASRNINANNAVILQAHMDMVAISDDNNPKKPIKLKKIGDRIYANKRTLGSDNGIGLATALAVAQNPKFKDMPLKIIFTVDEETSMNGAKAVKAEYLAGKYLINLDSEEYGIVTNGCSGNNTYNVEESIPFTPLNKKNYKKVNIDISHASGGHSGEDIGKGKLNPLKSLLEELNKTDNIHIVSINGGDKFNSIPRSAKAEFLMSQSQFKGFSQRINKFFKNIREKHCKTDPDLQTALSISKEYVRPNTKVLQKKFQDKLLKNFSEKLINGVLSRDMHGKPRTSQNLGVLNLGDGQISLSIMERSSSKGEDKQLTTHTQKLLKDTFNKNYSPSDISPIWEPKVNSTLTQKAIRAFEKQEGQKPKISISHGGTENCMFEDKIKEQISIGPNIEQPHTINENVSVSSVQKLYKFLGDLLLWRDR